MEPYILPPHSRMSVPLNIVYHQDYGTVANRLLINKCLLCMLDEVRNGSVSCMAICCFPETEWRWIKLEASINSIKLSVSNLALFVAQWPVKSQVSPKFSSNPTELLASVLWCAKNCVQRWFVSEDGITTCYWRSGKPITKEQMSWPALFKFDPVNVINISHANQTNGRNSMRDIALKNRIFSFKVYESFSVNSRILVSTLHHYVIWAIHDESMM